MEQFEKDIVRLANTLAYTLVKKNHDYGDSFAETMDKYGVTALLMRLNDKMNRLEKLGTDEPDVNDESFQDTLLDLAGYALLGLQYMNRDVDEYFKSHSALAYDKVTGKLLEIPKEILDMANNGDNKDE